MVRVAAWFSLLFALLPLYHWTIGTFPGSTWVFPPHIHSTESGIELLLVAATDYPAIGLVTVTPLISHPSTVVSRAPPAPAAPSLTDSFIPLTGPPTSVSAYPKSISGTCAWVSRSLSGQLLRWV